MEVGTGVMTYIHTYMCRLIPVHKPQSCLNHAPKGWVCICFDLVACICSNVGNGYLLSRLFPSFLTSNKFLCGMDAYIT